MNEQQNKIQEVSFKFLKFIVKESHIVLRETADFKINVNFNSTGAILKALNQFHLELMVEVKEETDKFHIVVNTISVFEFPENADLEFYRNNFFVLNAPAIVFPYIRAYISNLTTQSGLFTVTLPTFNLTAMGEALKGNIKEVE